MICGGMLNKVGFSRVLEEEGDVVHKGCLVCFDGKMVMGFAGGNRLESVILMTKVPADTAVSGFALPGCGGETCQGYPFIVPQRCIPDGFANLWEVAQIMVLLHQCLVVLLLAWLNGNDFDFP